MSARAVFAANQDAAQAYATTGWPVFPVAPGSKVPAIPRAHLPADTCRGECGRDGHGLYDATTDPDKIAKWWDTDPARNVAIATGAPGPDVLDVDVKPEGTGYPALSLLRSAGLVSSEHAVVRTPSTGAHLYFQGTSQPNGRLRHHHLDFRGKGGYVVAPPSQVDGTSYVVVRHETPTGATVDWDAIRKALDPQPEQPSAQPRGEQRGEVTGERRLDTLVGWIEGRQPGDRNFPLFLAAKQAEQLGLLDGQAVERLVEASRINGLRGGEREARATIASGCRAAQREAVPARDDGPFARPPQRQLEAG